MYLLFADCHIESLVWPVLLLLCCALTLIPLWWYLSHHNEYANDVLYTGWTPIIGAMIISWSVTGSTPSIFYYCKTHFISHF